MADPSGNRQKSFTPYHEPDAFFVHQPTLAVGMGRNLVGWFAATVLPS